MSIYPTIYVGQMNALINEKTQVIEIKINIKEVEKRVIDILTENIINFYKEIHSQDIISEDKLKEFCILFKQYNDEVNSLNSNSNYKEIFYNINHILLRIKKRLCIDNNEY